MAKINYSKVDSLAAQGMEKRKIDALFDETRADGEAIGQPGHPKLYLVESIRYDLITIPFYDKDFFNAIGLRKKEVLNLVRNPSSLTDKDWQLVEEVHQRIQLRKKEISDIIPEPTDDQIIEFEINRHINKRYNVNEGWLPLH